jgi:hypothetical protein
MFGQEPVRQKPIECTQVFAEVSYRYPNDIKLGINCNGSFYLSERYYDAKVDLLKRRPIKVEKDKLPGFCREDAEKLESDLRRANRILEGKENPGPFGGLFD